VDAPTCQTIVSTHCVWTGHVSVFGTMLVSVEPLGTHNSKKGPPVSSIESQVLQTFLEHIAADDEVSDAVVEGVRDALSANKLPKAEQLAEIFATGSGDTLA
jgi:hypothetical protein